jgi:LmbE family N-acetylglucosaminyl deacetylase
MRVRVGLDKLSLLLLLGVFLGLFVLGPPGSVFAELDEPPVLAEPAGNQGSVRALKGDGSMGQGRYMAGLDSGEAVKEAVAMDNLRRGVLAAVSWIFLMVGLTLVALTLRRTYIWLKAVQNARVPPTRYFNLLLQVRDRDGELGLYNFDYYPVVVAASGSADLLLPKVEEKATRFRIDYCQGQAQLLSDSSIIVNGVPRQSKPLKQDDRIIFGPYRLIFKDASIQEKGPPVPGKPAFAWQFPVVALLLALSVLFKQAGAVPEDRMLLTKAAELQRIEQQRIELDRAEPGTAVQGSIEQHVSATGSTQNSGEPTVDLQAEKVRTQRITLSRRPRWLFKSQSTEAVRIAETEDPESPAVQTAEEVSVAQPAVAQLVRPQPAVPQPAVPQPVIQKQETQRLEPRGQKAREQKTEAREPEEPKPARTAIAESDSDFRREVRPERTVPRTVQAAAGPAPRTGVTRPAPQVPDNSSPSRRNAASPQPLPVREPVLSSELAVETTAELPAPLPVKISSAAEEASQAQHREKQNAPALQASVLASVSPLGVTGKGIDPLEALSFAKARSTPGIGRVKVRVIPPGRRPEYFKADILFIHAHPDDESIDFGSLMAMASRSDKRIATLIFTDGESGLDLYPERKVGDIYPARDLTGGALAQVRVVEATRALSILGAEMYIRWGLENHPYNSKRDEIPPDEVIRGWGGEDLLVERLIEVLEGFRPTIVVSPDRHSKAYEHFEHEAVGQLVQTALERLRREGRASFVKGHIVSIDPYQVDRYSGVTRVEAQARDEQSGLDYRAIQVLALKEHVTQRDAAVIGVSRLSHLPEEYYKVLYWDLDLSLEEYLK